MAATGLKRIVVAVDGSGMAAAAFAAALTLARAVKVPVVGVHVVEPSVAEMLAANPGLALDPMAPPAMPPMPVMPPPESERGEPVIPEAIEDVLDDMGVQCEQQGVEFSTRIGRGTLVDWLVRHAQGGDLLAIGMKGRFARTGVGSTTRALATQAPCPVMVVNQEVGPLNRVMVAFDGTRAAEAALGVGRGIGGRAGWPVTVLAVGRGGGMDADAALARAEELAPGAQVLALGAEAGSAAAEGKLIERMAGSDRYALLVMGAYADSPWRDLFFGSTTSNVLSRIGGAVVLVHA